ncbi:MAG: hypothetical protein HOW73_23585 [Polyangiaceae bacterium]|nr:hypothetical protein [Polyangiaceae bacterium]
MRALVAAGVFTVAMVACGEASAHEPWTYGFGSRAAALGGAVAANVTDFSANYYNPAGLAGEEGIRIGVGYFWAENNLRLNDLDSGVKSSHGVSFGLAAAGDVFGFPIAIGIATHVPDEGLSRITALRQEVPRWELYDNRSSVIYLAANLAIRPWEFLEIGGGLSFLAATRGRFEITGAADLLHPYDSQLRHEVDVDLTSVRYPQAGVRVHLGKAAKLALVYRGQTNLDLHLDGRIDATLNAVGFEVPLSYELQARTVQAFLPQQVVLAASWKPHEAVSVDVDIAWVNWGAYKNPTAKTIAKLAAEIPPQFPVELPGELRQTDLLDLHFSDRIVPRLGVEWYLPGFNTPEGTPILKVPLRFGYVYEKTPVPDQTRSTNFVDADRHTISCGIGVEVPIVHLGLDVHAAVSALPETTVLKTSAADLTGDYRAEGEMLNVGATLTGNFQ